MLSISCPRCRKTLKGKDGLAGRMVTCPACKASFEVPLPDDWLAGTSAKQPDSEPDPLEFINSSLPKPLSIREPSQNPNTIFKSFKKFLAKNFELSGIGCFLFVLTFLGLFFGFAVICSLLPSLRTDPDLELVRAYLRENLPSGRWEELRRWPKRESRIKQYGFHGLRTWPGGKVCRLKFRVLGEVPVSQDIIFIITDEYITTGYTVKSPYFDDTEEWYQYVWNQQFPDDSQGLRISGGRVFGASSYDLPVAVADDDLHDTADIAAIKKLGRLDEKRPAEDSNRLDQVSVTPSHPANDPQIKKARDDRRDPKHIMQHQ